MTVFLFRSFNNYNSSRTKKFKAQNGRAKSMPDYAPSDYNLCKAGRMLVSVGTAAERTMDGTVRQVTRYRREDCYGCPHRAVCCKG
ncbi:MAG: hypothetical protein PHI98_02815 [Eubacteriales bacterium]|nr:hypothetical protein [Eubacteriales bacterium]